MPEPRPLVAIERQSGSVSDTNTQLISNTSFAVQANGASNIVGVQNSVLNGSPTGISLLNGRIAVSVGPSNLVTGAGSFSSTLAFRQTTISRRLPNRSLRAT
jgi:hypothetical protein